MLVTKKQKRRKNYSAKVNHSSGSAMLSTYMHNRQAQYQREKRQLISSSVEKKKSDDNFQTSKYWTQVPNGLRIPTFELQLLLSQRKDLEKEQSAEIDNYIWKVLGLMDKKYLNGEESLKFYQTIAVEVRRKNGLMRDTGLSKHQEKYFRALLDKKPITDPFTEKSLAPLVLWSEDKDLDNYRFKYLHSNILLWKSEQDCDLREVPKKEDCFLSDMLDFARNPSIRSYNVMVDMMREYALTIKYTLVLSSIEDI